MISTSSSSVDTRWRMERPSPTGNPPYRPTTPPGLQHPFRALQPAKDMIVTATLCGPSERIKRAEPFCLTADRRCSFGFQSRPAPWCVGGSANSRWLGTVVCGLPSISPAPLRPEHASWLLWPALFSAVIAFVCMPSRPRCPCRTLSPHLRH